MASNIDKVAKKNKIGGATNADAVVQKYLQAALVLDEHIAAAHGNDTADYMLVLANIVSNGVASEQDLQGMIGRRELLLLMLLFLFFYFLIPKTKRMRRR